MASPHSTSGTPRVSIVLPTHNRPALLAQAVRSVMTQSFEDWELIVVDDASDPPVPADRWPELADRVRVVRNATALGGGASKAIGARLARGPLLTFLDDDDLYAHDLLARALDAFAANDRIDVLFVGVRWFGRHAPRCVGEQAESMDRVLQVAPPTACSDEVWLFDDRLVEGLLQAIPMDFQRVVVRRAAFERIGVHRSDCLMWDCDWALRAALSARCALLRPGLYLQRADDQQYFSRPGRERAQMESAFEIALRLHRMPPPGTPARTVALLRETASRRARSLAHFHSVHGPLEMSLRAWWTSQRLWPNVSSARTPFAALVRAARRSLGGAVAVQPD